MEDKKHIGIKLFGWICIFISLDGFVVLFKLIILYQKLFPTFQLAIPKYIGQLTAIYILIIIGCLTFSLIWLATGIGLIKLKLWAHHVILALVLFELSSLILFVWVLGPQIHGQLYYIFKILIAAIIFFYFNKRNIKEIFGVGREKISLAAKALIGFLLTVTVIALLTAPLCLWYQYSEYKDILPLVNVKPEKIQYPLKDEAYLRNNGEKVTIFNYNIFLPKESKLCHISSDYGLWHLHFFKQGKDKNFNNLVFSISARTDIDNYLFRDLGFGKILHFNTSYELEKIMNYPTWSPLYLYFKIKFLSGGKEPFLVKKKEEIATLNWRGFAYIKQINTSSLFMYNLYGNTNESSTCISGILINRDNTITFDQMRDFISSIKFNQDKTDDAVFFNQGKVALANADYDSAAINFFNAFYINKQNPEYAYYLGRTLFMDDLKAFRRTLLSDSKYFLEYALKLKANYQDAKELLNQVNNELNML